jgi:glycosyltransferase involved in cell wall biosynthesis
MSKIRVLAIPSDRFGVGKYRIKDPLTYIKMNYVDEVEVNVVYEVPFSDNFFKNYDIVYFHNFIHKTSHEDNVNRVNWLKKLGIKTVMDTDDYWVLDSRHPMYNQIIKNGSYKKKIELLQLVDYVTTTTPFFAKSIFDKLRIKNVTVFPNALNPEEPQFIPTPIKSDRLRFGWLGGASHLYDIEIMGSGISRIITNYNDSVQFVLCGFDTRGKWLTYDKVKKVNTERPILPTETVWYKYEKIFTKNYTALDEDYVKFLMDFIDTEYSDSFKPYVRRWTRDIDVYGYNYNYFDVSLAPLTDTVFNNNKSELKIIESGFHKKPVIASDIVPYNSILVNAFNQGKSVENGNALLVSPSKNHKQWDEHMKKLIDSPNLVEDLGNKLYETVKDKYSLKTVCKDRVDFFKTIIN